MQAVLSHSCALHVCTFKAGEQAGGNEAMFGQSSPLNNAVQRRHMILLFVTFRSLKMVRLW